MPPPNAPQSSRSLPPTLNELVVDIRDRMPVILATRDYARWLGDEPDPGNLMQPFPANSILESVELAQE
jgi:putative SOS response-associated peptidase YedK